MVKTILISRFLFWFRLTSSHKTESFKIMNKLMQKFRWAFVRRKMVLITVIVNCGICSLNAQVRINLSLSEQLRTPLWLNNMEYTRNAFGKNNGIGLQAGIGLGKHYVKAGICKYHEGFRDVVRDEWRTFENYDTIVYRSNFNSVNFSAGLNILNKKVKFYWEPGLIFSRWNETHITAFGPKGKTVYDTLRRIEDNFRTGLWFRNGFSITTEFERLVLSAQIFGDIVFQQHWKPAQYKNAIEPYPNAAIGCAIQVGYIIFQKPKI